MSNYQRQTVTPNRDVREAAVSLKTSKSERNTQRRFLSFCQESREFETQNMSAKVQT